MIRSIFRRIPSFRKPRIVSGDDELAALAARISRQARRIPESAYIGFRPFRQQLTLRLAEMSKQLAELLQGRLCFASTEKWRTVYEDVLKSCRAKRYLSVALIRSDDYWRDEPGQASLEFNYDLIAHGFHIHRVFVIDEFFWPRTARTPSTGLFHWITSQHQRGIEVSLVRLSALEDEPDLVCDMGIYGDEATGLQQTDLEGRTVRFELRFDALSVRQAEQRWNQLLLYAKPLDELLD